MITNIREKNIYKKKTTTLTIKEVNNIKIKNNITENEMNNILIYYAVYNMDYEYAYMKKNYKLYEETQTDNFDTYTYTEYRRI